MKPKPRLARPLIEQLNADAAALVHGGITSSEAICEAARLATLIRVRTSENLILYRSRRGAFATARLEGPHGSYIGPGGL